jgi:murein DD-endopeptidase MepM/ murein hydrolase activator NlpD
MSIARNLRARFARTPARPTPDPLVAGAIADASADPAGDGPTGDEPTVDEPTGAGLAGVAESLSPVAVEVDTFSLPARPSPATRLPIPETVSPSDRWLWPVRGRISQPYSTAHPAIDVVSDHGARVVAADGGEVVYAEWEITGFGYLVIVDHGDGYQTYYGHLYGFYVNVGQTVARGEPLGQLGNTGNSTGPHLHFEIRRQGIRLDPLELLPSDPP